MYIISFVKNQIFYKKNFKKIKISIKNIEIQRVKNKKIFKFEVSNYWLKTY